MSKLALEKELHLEAVTKYNQIPLKRCLRRATLHHQSNSGFTLIEMLIVTLIVGILAAIVAPSWLSFIDARRLNTSQDQVYRAMRKAQSNAKRDKNTWQASFKEITVNSKPVVQWVVHPAIVFPTATAVKWNDLQQNVRIDSTKTTLTAVLVGSDSVSEALFNYKGCPIDDPIADCGQASIQGKITLSVNNSGQIRRCVIISTLLGAMRAAKDSGCS